MRHKAQAENATGFAPLRQLCIQVPLRPCTHPITRKLLPRMQAPSMRFHLGWRMFFFFSIIETSGVLLHISIFITCPDKGDRTGTQLGSPCA